MSLRGKSEVTDDTNGDIVNIDLSRNEWKCLVGVLNMERDLLEKGMIQCGSDSAKREWLKDTKELKDRLEEALHTRAPIDDARKPEMRISHCLYCNSGFSGDPGTDEDHIGACARREELKSRADAIRLAIHTARTEVSFDKAIKSMKAFAKQYEKEAKHI